MGVNERAPDSTIRLALVADSWEQPRWVVQGIEEAVVAGVVTIVAVGMVAGGGKGRDNRPFLRRAYDVFDRTRFRPPSEPFDTASLKPVAGPVQVTTITPPATIGDAMSAASADVILVLSDAVAPGACARYAREGAAVFALGGIRGTASPDVGFREVVTGESVINVRLELIAPDGQQTAQAIESMTNTHVFSAGRTRAIAALQAVGLLQRLARAILHERTAAATRGEQANPVAVYPPPNAGGKAAPALPPLAPSLAGLGMRYLRYVSGARQTRDQWYLAYHRSAGATTAAPSAAEVALAPEIDLARYNVIAPPADRFWADPFPLCVGGKEYLLIEELIFAEGVGTLAVLELGADGPVGTATTILKKPYHLSYPYIFTYEGTTYLLPETALEGRLELYRAVRAPYEWVFDRTLIEGPMLMDATIEAIDGRWWMFACEARPQRQPWTDLLLYYADSPLGPWTPHPRSPVVSDVRYARPAGRLFRRDGALLRPAQDCSRTYGGAISLRRIVTLTPTDYAEVEEQYLAGGEERGISGPHTLNRAGALSVIDLKRRVRR